MKRNILLGNASKFDHNYLYNSGILRWYNKDIFE